MIKTIETTGRNEEEAVAAALSQLGLSRAEISVELIERGKTGFLGIGAQPARIRVTYEVPDEKPAPAKKAAEPAKPAVKAEEKPAPAEKPAQKKPVEKKAVPAKAPESDDEKVQRLYSFLMGLFERMGTPAEAKIEYSEAENTISVELSGDKVGALIGRRGETLDAIQHLANYVINNGENDRIRINIDAENYRAKRADTLVGVAKKTAAKVVKYRKNMTLEPMNAYERHVIHTALQDFNGVTTYSTGTEPNRRVVIAYERGSAPRSDRRDSRPRRESRPADAAPVQPAEQNEKPARDTTTREWA